jgi:hypothetical protein
MTQDDLGHVAEDWPDLAYLLALRLRCRDNPRALAIIDRCLRIVARAAEADERTVADLSRQVALIADELAVTFGAPRSVVPH